MARLFTKLTKTKGCVYMRTIMVTGNETIQIGRVGENQAVQVIWPDLMGKWRELYGEGTVQLVVRRPKDTAPYPVVCEVGEDNVIWTVQVADTARHGIGECELTYFVGEAVVKSQTWATEILRGLTEDEMVEPPEAQKGWVDQVLSAGNSAQEAADRAEAAAIHQPYPNEETGTWWVWDIYADVYKDTGISFSSGGSVTVDNELSNTSENPVENRVIKSALDELANTAVTDEHINSLIDVKLGVIENGSY